MSAVPMLQLGTDPVCKPNDHTIVTIARILSSNDLLTSIRLGGKTHH